MSVRSKRSLALGGASVRGRLYLYTVLADSPLAFWLLNEASGSTFADSSGNGRNATITGTPTFGATALGVGLGNTEGPSTTFASGQHAVTSTASWLNSITALSIETWFKSTGVGNMFMLSRDNGSTDRQFQAAMNVGLMRWNVWNSAGTLTQLASPAGKLYSDGLPHHCVMTADATDLKIYVDGAQVASQGAGLTLAPLAASTLVPWIADYSGSGFQWAGGLEAVAVYSTVLSAARVLAHYQAGV